MREARTKEGVNSIGLQIGQSWTFKNGRGSRSRFDGLLTRVSFRHDRPIDLFVVISLSLSLFLLLPASCHLFIKNKKSARKSDSYIRRNRDEWPNKMLARSGLYTARAIVIDGGAAAPANKTATTERRHTVVTITKL